MSSFQSKLARLPRQGAPTTLHRAELGTGASPRPIVPAGSRPPSLDELRDRIARIIARTPASAPRASPAESQLPFFVERTDHGPLYVRRELVLPAARVGRMPLVSARDADPALIALLAACDPRRALYLDTETTGLAGGTGTVPFLLGLAWYDADEGRFMVEQMLLRRLGEEAPILERLTRRLADASMIVSFNGKAFDMPLLRTRFVMNRLPAPTEPPHLDLVHMARRIHKTRLRSRTLVAIEQDVLGRARVDDVAGGDIVATYMHFLRTGDEGALAGVVEHNVADVLAMVALVGLYGESVEPRQTPVPPSAEVVGSGSIESGETPKPPLQGILDGSDLAGVARTLRQAGALELAAQLADAAVAAGGGVEARRAVGDIAKARGDKARALSSFQALADEVDDAAVRLELCKLYEHHARDFATALAVAERGTGEDQDAATRRRERLTRKLARTR